MRLDIYKDGFIDFIKTLGIGTGWHGVAYHSFAVEVLAESGIIVFICLVLAFFDIYKKLNYITRYEKNKRTLRTANILKAGFIGYFVTSVSPASTLNIEWMGLMIAIFAVFCSLVNEENGVMRYEV